MKISLKKKNLKNLSLDEQVLPSDMTPQVGGASNAACTYSAEPGPNGCCGDNGGGNGGGGNGGGGNGGGRPATISCNPGHCH